MTSLAVVAALLILYATVSKPLDRRGVTSALALMVAGLARRAARCWAGSDVPLEGATAERLAEIALALLLFGDAARIDLTSLRAPARLAVEAAADRPAADHGRRRGRRRAGVPRPAAGLGGAARDHARLDRRRPGSARRHRRGRAASRAPGAERRERPERRPGRAVLPGLRRHQPGPAPRRRRLGRRRTRAASQIGWGLARRRRRRRSPARGAGAPRRVARLAREPVAADPHALDGDPRLRRRAGAGRQRLHRRLRRRSGVRARWPGLATCRSSSFTEDAGEWLAAVVWIGFGALALGKVPARSPGRSCCTRPQPHGRAMVPVALAMLGSRARRPTVAFLGWFGPRGLASIVFALIAARRPACPTAHLLFTTVTFTVALSVIAHGLTLGAARRRLPALVCRAHRQAARRRRGGAGRGAAVPAAGRGARSTVLGAGETALTAPRRRPAVPGA